MSGGSELARVYGPSALVATLAVVAGLTPTSAALGFLTWSANILGGGDTERRVRRVELYVEHSRRRFGHVERRLVDVESAVRGLAEARARDENAEVDLERLDLTRRDARHAAEAYGLAVEAEEDELAEALAAASVHAILGRTRLQVDAAALRVMADLTADGLELLRDLDGRTSASRLTWSMLDPLAALGLVRVNAPATARGQLSGSHGMRLTAVGSRVLELTTVDA